MFARERLFGDACLNHALSGHDAAFRVAMGAFESRCRLIGTDPERADIAPIR
jgi:hypothetical protein